MSDTFIVPIYDATNDKLEVSALNIFTNISSLPKLDADMESLDIALVAYTANTAGNQDERRICFNIQWAALLGKHD